jgi:hypothetical protein
MHGSNEELSQALALMETALRLIDEVKAAHQVGAHLDLAICRLKDVLSQPPGRSESGNETN